MTDNQKAEWRTIAERTLSKLDFDNHSQETFMLFVASLAILDHKELGEINIPTTYETPIQVAITHPMSKSLHEFVEDELSDAEMYYSMGEYELSKDELRHADRFLSVLKAQTDKNYLQELIARRNEIAAKL